MLYILCGHKVLEDLPLKYPVTLSILPFAFMFSALLTPIFPLIPIRIIRIICLTVKSSLNW